MKKYIIPFFIFVLGIFFLFGGISCIISYKKGFEKCNVPMKATVVGFEKKVTRRMNKTSSTVYYPIVEYQAEGRLIHKTASTGQNPPDYYEGQQIEIRYNKDNPEDFVIEGDMTMMVLGSIFTAVSIIVIAVSLIVFNVIKKEVLYG